MAKKKKAKKKVAKRPEPPKAEGRPRPTVNADLPQKRRVKECDRDNPTLKANRRKVLP